MLRAVIRKTSNEREAQQMLGFCAFSSEHVWRGSMYKWEKFTILQLVKKPKGAGLAG
jgi:hypothetical protein